MANDKNDQKYGIKIKITMEQTTEGVSDNETLFETEEHSEDAIIHVVKTKMWATKLLGAASEATAELCDAGIALMMEEAGKK